MTPQGQHQLEFPTSGGHDPNGDRATADIDVGVIGMGVTTLEREQYVGDQLSFGQFFVFVLCFQVFPSLITDGNVGLQL